MSDDWNKLKHLVDLSAENARLKAEVEHWQEQWHFVIQDNNKQMDEIAALKAENARLRKAGDDMAFHYQELVRIEWGQMTSHIPPSVIRWNAAKEGKQP